MAEESKGNFPWGDDKKNWSPPLPKTESVTEQPKAGKPKGTK